MAVSSLPAASSSQAQGVQDIIGNTSQLPAITPISPPSFSDAYNTASSEIGNPAGNEVSTLGNLANTIGTQSGTLAAGYQAEEPVVQNIYSALGQELANQAQTQESNINTQSQAQTGQQRTQAAQEGFNPDTGFVAAQTRTIQKGYNQQVQQVAQQYNVDAEQLAGEETKSIDDLQNEATQAILNGDEDQANIIGQVASLKMQQAQLVVSAADSIMQADSTVDAKNIQAQYDNELADVKFQTVDLEAQKLAIQSGIGYGYSNPNTGTVTNTSGGGSATDPLGLLS